MSETMTASERARDLISELVVSTQEAQRVWAIDPPFSEFSRVCVKRDTDRAALLAYVARLEACVAAARVVVDAELRTDLPYDEALDELRNRLAALDRPEE